MGTFLGEWPSHPWHRCPTEQRNELWIRKMLLAPRWPGSDILFLWMCRTTHGQVCRDGNAGDIPCGHRARGALALHAQCDALSLQQPQPWSSKRHQEMPQTLISGLRRKRNCEAL